MAQVAVPSQPCLHLLPWEQSGWITTGRSAVVLLAVVVCVAASHLAYLSLNCPIDLAEDEAYYWDWSRQLDYGYYSKGPLTPWLIRASCSIFGDTMPAVRLPAILLRAGTAFCTWWLALRLFRSPALALGSGLLGYTLPIFLPAGLVMTTDPPFLFLWGLACCAAVRALDHPASGNWLMAGAIAGVGFLAKFSIAIWFIGLCALLWFARVPRPMFRLALAVAGFIPFTVPVLAWNIRNDWVTLKHVAEDVGVTVGGFALSNLADLWIGQFGVVGPGMFILMLAAVASAVACMAKAHTPSPERRALLVLLCFGLPVFAGVLLTSLRQHPSASWPMASYFTLTILVAWFISRCRADPTSWSWSRWIIYPSVITGFIIVLAAHRTDLFYPAIKRVGSVFPSLRLSSRTDPTHRLHGWRSVARQATDQLRQMPLGSIVMAYDYQTAAAMAFYIDGQPRTRCAGTYALDRALREPFSQYDIWPDLRLDRESAQAQGVLGRQVLYLGPIPPEFRTAFERVEQLPDLVAVEHGLEVRRVVAWRCYGFRGLNWPGWDGRYNK